MEPKPKIMIVDDAEINRELLISILGNDYEYVQAENGREALHILGQDLMIDLILLDINMPQMDGFQVLERMNKLQWINEIPVIMISSEEGNDIIERAYAYGVQDYIRRPFETFIVCRRVQNILNLYRNQRYLKQMVSEQIYEKEENNNLMISILSRVVEFRNSESREHILHIRIITELLLRQIVQKTDEYQLTEADIATITMASALHDIGKMSIPESILNKPGRLTSEEFDIMKSHAAIGADIIRQISVNQEKPLLRIAREICLWHHERWNGHGYPDGLRGEQIPIAAQVVAIADVYDALISKRCYKEAYDHETAMNMIMDGECGSFNPFLLDCFREIAPRLRAVSPYDVSEDAYRYEAERLSAEIMQKTDIPYTGRVQQLLDSMQEKLDFFASISGKIQFSYDANSGLANIVNWNEPPKYRYSTINVADTTSFGQLSQKDTYRLKEALEATTPENREFAMSVMLPQGAEYHWCDLRAHTLWSENVPEHYVGAVGQLMEPKKILTELPVLDGLQEGETLNGEKLHAALGQLEYIFDIVRLVDPTTSTVLEIDDKGVLRRTDQHCAAFWENGEDCANCISTRALSEKTSLNKLEFTKTDMYYVAARYLCINGTPCVLEMLSKMNEGRWIDSNGTRFLINKYSEEAKELFTDPVTGAYSRRYFESYRPHLEGMECVEIIDVDQFKKVNDTYGHTAGDMVLKDIVLAIQSCIRSTDILIRYGGDEFLLLFPKLQGEKLAEKNKKIQEAVADIVIPEYPELHLSVSIGGVCDVHPLTEAICQADKLMYQNKKSKDLQEKIFS